MARLRTLSLPTSAGEPPRFVLVFDRIEAAAEVKTFADEAVASVPSSELNEIHQHGPSLAITAGAVGYVAFTVEVDFD